MKKGYVHHLAQYSEPQKQLRSCVDCVTFHFTSSNTLIVDQRHADKHVFDLGLKAGEKAIITKISMPYATNDTGRHVEFELQELFGATHPFREDGKHPDYTGKVRFVVPRSANGRVPHTDRLIYEPNFTNLGFPVIQYAGLEYCIMSARSTAIGTKRAPDPEFELFKRTDHLVVFLLQNKVHFKQSVTSEDVVIMPDSDHVMITKRAITIARDFFQSAIFPLFLYTTTNFVKLDWMHQLDAAPADDPIARVVMTTAEEKHAARRNDGFSIVVLFLEIEYLVIEPDAPRYTAAIKPFLL